MNNKTKNVTNIKLAAIPITIIKPLTVDLVQENLTKYTYEAFLRGKKGILKFIEGLITLENKNGEKEINFAFTDPSRHKYHRLIETREWKLDEGGSFINTILDEIKIPALDYSIKYQKQKSKDDFFNKEVFSGIISSGEDRLKLVKDIKTSIGSIISV
jgi:hypothetical protein